jgi:hypothetical protein
MRPLASIAALLCAGCVIVVNPQEQPDSGRPDSGHGGGGGGGGGGGDLDGSIDWGNGGPDAGIRHGFPGSGEKGDPGTALLVLFRLDHGTANLAAAEETMTKALVVALEGAQLKVSTVTALNLYGDSPRYDPPIWQSFLGVDPGITLANALRVRAAVAEPAPTTCTTSNLMSLHPGVYTRAMMVVLVDHGPRPRSADCDTFAAAAAADPNSWMGSWIPRAQMRFVFIATPEGMQPGPMQSACLALPGFPRTALDALAPSQLSFFDTITGRINSAQPQLATEVDLCDALGDGWLSRASQIAKAWSSVLQQQP